MAFTVNATVGSFERNSATGRAVLRFGKESVVLQSPWDPRTQFSLMTTRKWQANLGGHGFTVIKRRARMFGGLRDAAYQVYVDGALVSRRRGM